MARINDETYAVVNEDNLAILKETIARDQADELVLGCETWGILNEGQRGQMTVWPNGRAAVCYGADSMWGDWDGKRRVLLPDDSEEIAYIDEEGTIAPAD